MHSQIQYVCWIHTTEYFKWICPVQKFAFVFSIFLCVSFLFLFTSLAFERRYLSRENTNLNRNKEERVIMTSVNWILWCFSCTQTQSNFVQSFALYTQIYDQKILINVVVFSCKHNIFLSSRLYIQWLQWCPLMCVVFIFVLYILIRCFFSLLLLLSVVCLSLFLVFFFVVLLSFRVMHNQINTIKFSQWK